MSKPARTLAAPAAQPEQLPARPKVMDERVNVWFPKELRDRIKQRARQEDRTEGAMIRRLCEIALLLPGAQS